MVNICITASYDILDSTYGGGARVKGLLKALSETSEIDKIVVVYPFAKTYYNKNIVVKNYLSHRSFNFLRAFHNVSIIDEINPFRTATLIKIVRKFNINLLQNESIVGGLNSAAVSKYCNIPLVIDEHNFEADITKEVRRNRLIQLYSKWLENSVIKSAAFTLTVSEEDRRKISLAYDIDYSKTAVIPNGVDYTTFHLNTNQKVIAKSKLQLDGKFVLFFHGSLDYGPNKEAVTLISDFVLPRVVRKIPNAFFLIVGRNPPLLSYDPHFLKFTGYVPNLIDYLAASDLAIVPLLRGGGTKTKLLDYLASGVPIIATRKAVEGLPLENNVHALLSETVDEDFIENILTLYNNQILSENISRNCQKLAEKYDWKSISRKLVQIYQKLM